MDGVLGPPTSQTDVSARSRLVLDHVVVLRRQGAASASGKKRILQKVEMTSPRNVKRCLCAALSVELCGSVHNGYL